MAHNLIFVLTITGRFVIGLNCGINTVIAPMFLTEISPVQHRGMLGTLNQLGIVSSILISQVRTPYFTCRYRYWDVDQQMAVRQILHRSGSQTAHTVSSRPPSLLLINRQVDLGISIYTPCETITRICPTRGLRWSRESFSPSRASISRADRQLMSWRPLFCAYLVYFRALAHYCIATPKWSTTSHLHFETPLWKVCLVSGLTNALCKEENAFVQTLMRCSYAKHLFRIYWTSMRYVGADVCGYTMVNTRSSRNIHTIRNWNENGINRVAMFLESFGPISS